MSGASPRVAFTEVSSCCAASAAKSISVQSGAMPYVVGHCQAVTARSLAPVARAYSAAQRSAARDWSDASTPTRTTGDGDPVDIPSHLFCEITSTLLRSVQNGQGRKSRTCLECELEVLPSP